MKKLEPTHTIFFDLGNVLLFFNLEKMVYQLADCMKISHENLRNEQILRPDILQKYESGHLTSEDLYHHLQSKSSHPFSFREMMIAMADIFTPNKEIWPLVEKLKSQGKRLVLISNTNECHFNYAYSHYSILKQFDRFILSYEVGVCKPDPIIFEKAIKEAKGQTFYTDDIPAYVEAGRAAGLDAEIFTDVPTLQKQLEDRKIFS